MLTRLLPPCLPTSGLFWKGLNNPGNPWNAGLRVGPPTLTDKKIDGDEFLNEERRRNALRSLEVRINAVCGLKDKSTQMWPLVR